jgi:hypothetical protein
MIKTSKPTPLTFSSEIHGTNQITNSIERQDYALNLFDKMDDVDMGFGNLYGIKTNADAHADSLVESLESQAYLSQVSVTNNITLSQ